MVMLTLAAASSASAWAGSPHKHLTLRHITAVRPDTTLTLLDSVVSDKYRKLYEYNDYGYITSKKVYQKGVTWELDTIESYEQTFAFAPDGKCIERVQYTLSPDGKRARIDTKGSIAQEGDLTWERYWNTEDGLTYMSEANAYDKWGFLAIHASYDIDYISPEPTARLTSYQEMQHDYSRQLPDRSHCRFDLFEQDARTRVITGYETLTWSPERNDYWKRFCVNQAWRKSSEIVNGVLVIKTQGIPFYKEFSLDEIDSQWEGDEHDAERYTLNADGTRPVSLSQGGETTGTWQWDSKGRLLKATTRHTTETFTYADDYARKLSLQEVMEHRNGLTLYPEDELECFYGHAATFRHENTSDDDKYYEECTMEYDAQGRLSRANWTEVSFPHDYYTEDENGNLILVSPTDSTVERGFITFHYNADGHLDYEIDHLESGDRIKTQYTYDSKGIWTGYKEYYASSGEEVAWSNSLNARHARHHRSTSVQKRSIGEDLSEGNHHIQEKDGIWRREGEYYVTDGKIDSGYYREWLTDDAATPSAPELNYTDPEMPFGGDDDDWDDGIKAWIYHWNQDTEAWELSSALDYLSRTYQDGALIRRDTYNTEKKIVRTDTYTKDSAGRLVKQEWTMTDAPEENGSYEYTYLDGETNYLSTRQTHSAQDNETRRYYYSNRAYLAPTGIKATEATAPKSDAYYDLQGRKVSHPSRGIYVHQGRKVVVK